MEAVSGPLVSKSPQHCTAIIKSAGLFVKVFGHTEMPEQ